MRDSWEKDNRKFESESVTEAIGPFHEISAYFEAERYDDKALDTLVQLRVDHFSITWKDRFKLMKELAAVIEKYQI